MIDRAKSEELMLAKEAGYISGISEIKGTSPEALATMVALYRAGWRDCWEAEIFAEMTKIRDKIEALQETD